MIREFIYEKMVQMIMEDAGARIKTVGSYAVIDYGFDVKHQDGNHDRAGYILRQAHRRARGDNSMLSRESSYAVEKILRRYGVTSSGETYAFRNGSEAQSYQWDYTNIQGTENRMVTEIIDFGAYLAIPEFHHDLSTSLDFTILQWPHGQTFSAPRSCHAVF